MMQQKSCSKIAYLLKENWCNLLFYVILYHLLIYCKYFGQLVTLWCRWFLAHPELWFGYHSWTASRALGHGCFLRLRSWCTWEDICKARQTLRLRSVVILMSHQMSLFFRVGLVISFLALNNLMESSLDSARWSSVAWSLPHPIFNALSLEMNAEENEWNWGSTPMAHIGNHLWLHVCFRRVTRVTC